MFHRLIVLAILIPTVTQAQLSYRHYAVRGDSLPAVPEITPVLGPITGPGIAFYNDLSNPSEWIIGNEFGNTDDWVVGTDVPSGPHALTPISSATAGNGFALFDSDSLCGGDQDAWIQYNGTVDLSSHSDYLLEFATFYRNFGDTCLIEYSADGGQSWVSDTLFAHYFLHQLSKNAEVVRVNVPASIAGNSSVTFRFRYIGACDYAWMIDDIKIYKTPDYAWQVEEFYFSICDTAVLSHERLPITMTDDCGTFEIAPLVRLKNLGTQPMIDVGGYLQMIGTLQPNQIPFATVDTLLPGNSAEISSNCIEYWTYWNYYMLDSYPVIQHDDVTADSLTLIDTISFNIDNAWLCGSTRRFNQGAHGSGIWGGADSVGNHYNFVLGSVYGMVNYNCSFSRLEVGISHQTEPGNVVYPYIVELQDSSISGFQNSFGNVVFDGAQVGNGYTIQNNDPGSIIEIHLQSGVALNANKSYFIGLGFYGGSGRVVLQDASIKTPFGSSFMYAWAGDPLIAPEWYMLNTTPMIGITVGISSVEENMFTFARAWYNGMQERIEVQSNDRLSHLELYDINGRQILTKNTTELSVSIACNGLSQGVYFLRITNADGLVQTEKLLLY